MKDDLLKAVIETYTMCTVCKSKGNLQLGARDFLH